jgi:hypothetical protein
MARVQAIGEMTAVWSAPAVTTAAAFGSASTPRTAPAWGNT